MEAGESGRTTQDGESTSIPVCEPPRERNDPADPVEAITCPDSSLPSSADQAVPSNSTSNVSEGGHINEASRKPDELHNNMTDCAQNNERGADEGSGQQGTDATMKQEDGFHTSQPASSAPQMPSAQSRAIPRARPIPGFSYYPPSLTSMQMPTVNTKTGPEGRIEPRDVPPEYWSKLEHNASFLHSRSLYQAYQLDLLRRTKLEREGREDKGPELVRAMAEYVGVVEEQIANLQLQNASARTEMTNQHAKDGPADPLASGQEKTTSTEMSGGHGINPRLETRFYHYEGHFDMDGDCPPACTGAYSPVPGNSHHPSHSEYACQGDPQYIIRVLFDGKTGRQDQNLRHGETPNANEVDVIAFMVESKPIAEFFAKRLRVEMKPSWLLRFSKPFRSVIRNAKYLRDHLSSLVVKYEKELGENHESTEADENGECGLTKQPGSGTEESYERPEALAHFRYLVQFVDQYLGAKIELFENLRGGREERIKYEDLWMLFDAGDKIYSPHRQGHTVIQNEFPIPTPPGTNKPIVYDVHTTRRRYVPQAYRVVATTGGGPLQTIWAAKDVKVDGDYLQNNAFLQVFMDQTARTTGIRTQQTDFQPKHRMKERYSPLYVLCIYIDFDGVKFGTVTEIFVFKPFDGESSIKSLEAYPFQYFVNPRPDYLLRRGRKFIDVTLSSKHMSHTGYTVGVSKEELNSAVVVDLKLAFTEYQREFPEEDSVIPVFQELQKVWPDVRDELPDVIVNDEQQCAHGPYCHGYSCIADGYRASQKAQLEKLQPGIQEVLEEFEFLLNDEGDINGFKKYLEDQDLIELLPGVVPGFALRHRAWVQLNLDQLDFVEQQDEWKKLALPKGHRQIVQAMVETHSNGLGSSTADDIDNIEMDLVRGKGKGCIILLHGVPGVGKTSTAECVAAYTKRPLYFITCGDVGYEPEDVERNMGKHFKLADRWGCVLLLDEADVFLAKRNKTDVKRNGLVSSFLRILEYYSGILFLTTNRVGAIDDAFRSRLHLTLYYPKLTRLKTLKIWKTNLQRLEEINTERLEADRQPIEFDAKKIVKWVAKRADKIEWNGRQIRNAFQTAVALAEFEAKQDNAKRPGSPRVAPVLKIGHFKLLAAASKQFSNYLHRTHGEDEDERAALDKIRPLTVPSPVKVRDKDFDDDEEDEEEEDDDSTSGSDSASDEESNTEAEGVSDISSEDDSSESQKRSKKKGKKGGKGKAKSAKEERREKGKGRKR